MPRRWATSREADVTMREVLEVESSGCWLPMMVGILMILCVKTYLLRVTGWKFHSTSLPSFEKDVQCTDPLEAREVLESWKSARNCPCCDWCTQWFQNCSKCLRRCSFLGCLVMQSYHVIRIWLQIDSQSWFQAILPQPPNFMEQRVLQTWLKQFHRFTMLHL